MIRAHTPFETTHPSSTPYPYKDRRTENNNNQPPAVILSETPAPRHTRPCEAEREESKAGSSPPADAPPKPVRETRGRVLHLLGHLLRAVLHALVPRAVLPRGGAVRLDGLLAGGRERGHPLVVAGLRAGLLGGRGVLWVCAWCSVRSQISGGGGWWWVLRELERWER